jgi:hypothetical protein
MEMWPHAFNCKYTVSLGADSLDTEFCVTNTGDKPFDFTAALHTYWSVSGIKNIKITSPAFKGATYLDKMQSPPADVKSDKESIVISEEVDQVYAGVSGERPPSLLARPARSPAQPARPPSPLARPARSPAQPASCSRICARRARPRPGPTTHHPPPVALHPVPCISTAGVSTRRRRCSPRGLQAQAPADHRQQDRLERHRAVEPLRQRGHGLRQVRVRRVGAGCDSGGPPARRVLDGRHERRPLSVSHGVRRRKAPRPLRSRSWREPEQPSAACPSLMRCWT